MAAGEGQPAEEGEEEEGPPSAPSTGTLRKRLRELRKLSGELEDLERGGRKQARRRHEALSGPGLDLQGLLAYAARLRTGPPVGFPVTEGGLPAEPLPSGFWLPHPTAQEEIPKARHLWTGAGRAPPPEVEVIPSGRSFSGQADAPGPYSIVCAAGMRRTSALDSEPVGTLAIGTVVAVTEVVRVDEKRVRGRVAGPAGSGWISILNLETGYRWAEKLGSLKVRVRALPPATKLFCTTDGSLPRPGAASSRKIESGASLQLRLGGRLFVAAFAVGMRASDTVTVAAPRPPPAALGSEAPAEGRAREPAATVAAAPGAREAAPADVKEAAGEEQKAPVPAAPATSGPAAAAPRPAAAGAGAPGGGAKAKAKEFRGGLLLGLGDSDEEEEEMDDDESSG